MRELPTQERWGKNKPAQNIFSSYTVRNPLCWRYTIPHPSFQGWNNAILPFQTFYTERFSQSGMVQLESFRADILYDFW